MPLEGHWARQHTPLRRTSGRERRVIAILGALLAAAIVALVVYLAVGSGDGARAAGCVDVTAAHTTGGARLHACGEAARRLCREEARADTPLGRALRPQCAAVR